MRNLINILFSLLFCATLLPAIGEAQTKISDTEAKEHYCSFWITRNIRQLYKNGMYLSAIGLYESNKERLTQESELESEAFGYALLSAVKLQKPEAEGLIMEYATKYPESLLLSRIRLVQADICFNNGEFDKSKRILSEIDPSILNIEDLSEYYYKRGYSEMSSGNNELALTLFEKVMHGTETPANKAAIYFSAEIHFKSGNYKKAADLYTIVSGSKKYGEMSRYRIMECMMKLKEFDFIIREGERIFMSSSPKEKKGLARILSEAFYQKGDTKWAKYYFNLYTSNLDSLNRRDSYYSAQLYYEMSDYSHAAPLFEAAAGKESDSLAQSANYNLGKSLVMMGEKSKAVEAFRRAAESNADSELTEEAKFIRTKLEFDLNRKEENLEKLLNQDSPTQQQRDEIYFYIASSQINRGDYDRAANSLRKIKYPDKKITATLQRVLFLNGMRQISKGAYKLATPLFQDALKFRGLNNYIDLMSQYWLAECLYRTNKYEPAINLLRTLQNDSNFKESDKYADSFFDSGYCFYKEGAYTKALNEFNLYVKYKEISEQEMTSGRGRESSLRIADCYYHTEEFAKAAAIYEKMAIFDHFYDLHIPFQAAVSYGMAGYREKKQALLQEILSNGKSGAPYYSNAAYELGLLFIQTSKSDKAESLFSNLAKEGDTTFRYKALFNLGTISLNKQDYDSAIKYYKMVISRYPDSKEGSEALAGIENIYQMNGNEEEFSRYMDSLQSSKRPESVKRSAKEYFKAGENYLSQGKLSAAADAFYQVIMLGEGDYSEMATLNYAAASYRLRHYGDAIKAYETLEQIASSDNTRIEAGLGSMRSYFKAMRYESAAEAADNMLTLYPGDEEIVLEAKFIKGKSLIESGKRDEGHTLLQEVPAGLRAAFEKEVKR